MKKNILNQGVTLIELLFTLSILVLLVTASYPSLSSFIHRHAQENDAMRLFHALEFARTEAIKRNQTVSVCGSDDLQHCSQNWSHGYLIFTSLDKPFIRVEKNASLTTIDSGQIKTLYFRSDGVVSPRGTIFIHAPNQDTRTIVFYDSGRIRMGRDKSLGYTLKHDSNKKRP